MATAVGTIDTLLRDVRRWINDRGINPNYPDDELLRLLAHAYDRAVEDVFTTPLDKPFMDFDLPLFSGKQEYVLPTGFGHIYRICFLSLPATNDPSKRIVSGIIPAYGQDDIRGPGWRWNPPILRFANAPTADYTVRITFVPRAIEYVHKGLLTLDTDIVNGTYDTGFLISVSSDATGTFKLWWKGETTSAISVSASAASIQSALESLTGITSIDVVGDPGGPWTVTFVDPLGNLPPFEVSVPPTDGEVVVTRVGGFVDTTVVLSASPTAGLFDPRPNAYIAGRLRLLTGSNPQVGNTKFSHFPWQERDIIEYDPATRKAHMSSPFDFTPYGVITYEILPLAENALLYASSVETARSVLSMSGNMIRAREVRNEYDIALVTARRLLGARNKALDMRPTPKRYLRESRIATDGVISASGIGQGLDRFFL